MVAFALLPTIKFPKIVIVMLLINPNEISTCKPSINFLFPKKSQRKFHVLPVTFTSTVETYPPSTQIIPGNGGMQGGLLAAPTTITLKFFGENSSVPKIFDDVSKKIV